MPAGRTACAWLCDARMAGPSVYFGTYTPKPWLGPDVTAPWDVQRLEALCSLLWYSSLLGGPALWLLVLAVKGCQGE